MANVTIYTQSLTEAYRLYEGIDSILHYMQLGSNGMPGGDFGVLVYTVMALTVALAFLKIKDGISPFVYLGGFAIPIMVYMALFSARVDVRIETFQNQSVTHIDDVPLGLALPLQTMSVIEYNIVQAVDDWMMPVDAYSFAKWDFLGQIKTAQTLVETDYLKHAPHVTDTIDAYIDNCLVHRLRDAAYYGQDIRLSPNLIEDFRVDTQAFFSPVFAADGSSAIQTCTGAYSQMIAMIQTEATKDKTMEGLVTTVPVVKDGMYTDATDMVSRRAEAKVVIDDMMGNLFPGFQSTTEQALTQMIMINSIRSNLAKTSPELLTYWGQASANQRTASIISSGEYLDMMNRFRPMLKLAVVLMFPLFGAFFVTQNGRPFLGWVSAVLWVSLWLPMEAIVHAAYTHYFIGNMRIIADDGGATWNNVVTMNDMLASNADAGAQLMFFLVPLSGMVIAFLAPKAASAVGGMIAGTHRVAQAAGSAGAGAMSGAQKSAKELEVDKMNASMMMVSDKFLTQGGAFKNNWGLQNNQPWGIGISGDTSGITGGGKGKAAGGMSGSWGIDTKFNSADEWAAQKRYEMAWHEAQGAMRSAGYTMSNGMGGGSTDEFVAATGKTVGFDRAAETSTAVQRVQNAMRKVGIGETFDEKEMGKVATTVTGYLSQGLDVQAALQKTFGNDSNKIRAALGIKLGAGVQEQRSGEHASIATVAKALKDEITRDFGEKRDMSIKEALKSDFKQDAQESARLSDKKLVDWNNRYQSDLRANTDYGARVAVALSDANAVKASASSGTGGKIDGVEGLVKPLYDSEMRRIAEANPDVFKRYMAGADLTNDPGVRAGLYSADLRALSEDPSKRGRLVSVLEQYGNVAQPFARTSAQEAVRSLQIGMRIDDARVGMASKVEHLDERKVAEAMNGIRKKIKDGETLTKQDLQTLKAADGLRGENAKVLEALNKGPNGITPVSASKVLGTILMTKLKQDFDLDKFKAGEEMKVKDFTGADIEDGAFFQIFNNVDKYSDALAAARSALGDEYERIRDYGTYADRANYWSTYAAAVESYDPQAAATANQWAANYRNGNSYGSTWGEKTREFDLIENTDSSAVKSMVDKYFTGEGAMRDIRTDH